MSRVIKFRAQQFNHGKHGFQYGSYVTDCEDYHAIIKESKSSPDEMYNVLINPETLGQFTGLKDKNGVGIYEGDVVKKDSNICEVIFSQKAAKFCVRLPSHQWHGVVKKVYSIIGVEVIGNIHENPELIN